MHKPTTTQTQTGTHKPPQMCAWYQPSNTTAGTHIKLEEDWR